MQNGCRILATMHGERPEDVKRRFGVDEEIWWRLFDLYILLGKEVGRCVVREVRTTGD